MSLYRKYRPKKFSEISGQKHIVQTLSNSIAYNRIGHAYLFTGSRGIGKTTLARIFAKTVNCLDPKKGKETALEPCNKCQNCLAVMEGKTMDLIEIDAASHTGVDNIRQLKENVNLPPSLLKKKIYIIDEVHMLSTGAFNALLKTLEEPPEHSIFILATTELHKVPETIISRCQRFDFHRFDQTQIVERLKRIAKKEKIEVENEALESIALEAEGGMRDAESLLGQIISMGSKKITSKEINQILGISSKKKVVDFVIRVLEGKTQEALKAVEEVQNDGYDLKNFNKNVLSVLRSVMIAKIDPELARDEASFTSEHNKQLDQVMKTISGQDILFAVNAFQESLNKSKEVPIPQLPLEMAAMEIHLHFNQNGARAQTQASQQTETAPPPAKSQPGSQDSRGQASPPQPSARPEEKPNVKPEEKSPETKEDKKVKNEISQPENQNQQPEKGSGNEKEDGAPNPEILKSVLDNWNQILETVKPANHSIHACLKNCVPMGVKDQEFFIKTKYSFYKDRLGEAKNKLTISEAIAKITGYKIKIRIVSEKEAEKLEFNNKQQNGAEERNVLHDAMRMMGGKIIE